MLIDPMATHTIWSAITPQESHDILCKVQDENKKLYRSAVEILSKQMQKRVPVVLEMPKVERHAIWQQILAHPMLENLSFNVLSSWLVQTQTPLLCAWLDSLQIQHDADGFFQADSLQPPSKESLQKSIASLVEKFPAKTVSIYLRVFNQIEGIEWSDLDALIESEPRLKLT
jgi:hypothetical protein